MRNLYHIPKRDTWIRFGCRINVPFTRKKKERKILGVYIWFRRYFLMLYNHCKKDFKVQTSGAIY